MARVLIINPHPLSCLGIATVLERAGHEVVGMENNGLDGVALARTLNPNLIILDLDLARMGGLDVLKRLQAVKRPARVLVFTAKPAGVYEHLCIAAGASGFVAASDSDTTLKDAVAQVLSGRSFFRTSAIQGEPAFSDHPLAQLTAREITVLHYLADGYRVKQIAGEMAISDRTVSTYKTRLLEKIGANSLVELLQLAAQRGLLERRDIEGSKTEPQRVIDLKFNSLLDAIPHPICLRAPDGIIQAANEAFTTLLGVSQEQIFHALLRDLGVIDPEHLDYYRSTFDAAVANKAPYMMVVTIYVRGQRKVMRHSGCPVIDDAGELVGMLCSTVDLEDEANVIQSLRDELLALKTLRKRRGSYLIEQQAGIGRDTRLALAAVQRAGNDYLRDTVAPLLQGIIESVTLIGDLVRFENDGQVFSPYPQNMNALTAAALNALAEGATPRHSFMEATGEPMAWVDAEHYATLVKVIMLHLANIGADDVSITAEAFDPHPSKLNWHLRFEARLTRRAIDTPAIHLALASEVCQRFNGDLVVEAVDPSQFIANVSLSFTSVTPHS